MIAFTRFRSGSHTLEIERGRYTNPKTLFEERLCLTCTEIEDEKHFLTVCRLFDADRKILYSRISELQSEFMNLNNDEQFIFLMKNDKPQILSWTAKFIHDSMNQRSLKTNS